MEDTTLRITTGGTTYEKFMEALSNVYPVYEHCDGRETVFKDYQQVKIETSDGIIDGYITYTYGIEIQAKEEQHS